MKKNRFLILALIITILGFLLRLWYLGSVPPSLNWDEAALGYNAYSILKTGRDEYGKFLPLILKSFGDYKPAFYVYLVTLSELFFGLNEFAIRLPSALLGSLGIFLIFLVVKELFSGLKEREIVALLSSFILATSPWHYHFSHVAFEANILMTFLLLGIWLFLKADKENLRFFCFSAFSFGACFYIYQGAKMLVPLIILGLLVFFWKKVKRIPKETLIISFIIVVAMALPIYFSIFIGGSGNRLKVMSIFSYPQSNEDIIELAEEGGISPQSLEFKVFHGNFNYYTRRILERYLNHFSPKFFFFEGDWGNPRHRAPNVGVLNFLDALFLPLGAYYLLTLKTKNKGLIWYLLLITPLPAAFSKDMIQAIRSFFMVIPFTIINALGMYFVWRKTVKMKSFLRIGLIGILAAGYLFSFIYYLDMFIIHLPVQNSQHWQYGYKEAVSFVAEKGGDYSKVIFTQKYYEPYIYYLFYTRYDPVRYQGQAKLTEDPSGDVGIVESLDNIEFRNIYWPKDRYEKNCLFIGGPYELPEKDIVPEEARLIGKIEFINGETAFHIVETVK